MNQFDEFATSLLEEAKRFLEKAKEECGTDSEQPYLHAALMLGCCALEAHVNSVCDEFSTRAELSLHERGILLEQQVRFEGGIFELVDRLKMSRLEDRIALLHQKFSRTGLDRNASWRSKLSSALDLRNKLTHPKQIPQINFGAVESAIAAVIETTNALYQAVYHRPLPAANLNLASKLAF